MEKFGLDDGIINLFYKSKETPVEETDEAKTTVSVEKLCAQAEENY